MGRSEEDKLGISGGRFVQPAANELLPGTREYKLQGAVTMEPGADFPFHMGAALTGTGITLVTVVVGSTVKPLWSASGGYASPAPTVTVGLGWEIHTTYSIISDGACSWFMTCMCNGVPASPTGGHGERAGSAVNLIGQTGWDFNMPAMVAAGQSVRVKLWFIADQYTAYPAQSLW